MKQLRALAATMVVLTMALAVGGCGHSRDDEDDDRAQTFDQVGEMRVFDEQKRPAPLPHQAVVAKTQSTVPTRNVVVAHAKNEARFDQIGEADIAE
jgi:hypothetical protein